MKRLLSSFIACAFVLALGSGAASAKQCRDAKGKFVKCPTSTMMPAPKRCRDAKGKFTKCPTSSMMK